MQQISEQLSQGSHRQRVAFMVETGQRASTHPDIRNEIVALSRATPHLRQFAIFAFQAAADGESLCRMALEDPSLRLRQRAVKAATSVAGDEQLVGLLTRLSQKAALRALKLLRRKARQELIDSWLDSLERPELSLLGYASSRLLDKHKTRLLERGDSLLWRRLATYQPEWAASVCLQGAADFHAVNRVRTVLETLAARRRPEVWPTWRRAAESDFAPYLTDQLESQLFLACPLEATEWAMENFSEEPDGFSLPPGLPSWPYAKAHRRYSQEQLLQLYRRGDLSITYSMWQRRPLAERLELWKELRYGVTYQDGSIQPVWLHRLDAKTRKELALTQSALPRMESDHRWQAECFSMLDWDDAMQHLTPLLGSPDVETRASATLALVGIARHQRERLPEILTALSLRKNEPDPVRCAFLQGLSVLGPSRYQPEHLETLEAILQALVRAADASAQSYRHAENLLVRLLPQFPQFASSWLSKILRHWGSSSATVSWREALRRGEAAELTDHHLSPLLSDWAKTERHQAFFGLLRHLGDSLEALPRVLQSAVELCSAAQPEVASQAFQALQRGAPDTARELLPRLLAADASWIAVPGVRLFLHRHRQDLLDPYLRPTAVTGRFASGETSWVLSFPGQFWRWTPTQQRAHEKQLKAILEDASRDFPGQRHALRTLAQLPDLGKPELLEWAAALADERQAVRDEALRCLARVEDSAGVESLVEALADERARVAVYALRTAVLAMPGQVARGFLLQIESPKITVKKEVARLLGELPDGAGVSELLRRWAGTSHRDLRLAILRGLWPHLDNDQAWGPFEEALKSEDRAVALALTAIPTEGLGPTARDRVFALLATLLKHPSTYVRQTVLGRLSGHPISGAAAMALRQGCETLLADRQLGFTAACALLAQLESEPQEWEALLERAASDKLALKNLMLSLRYNTARYRERPHFPEIQSSTRRRLAAEEDLLPLLLEYLASTDFSAFLDEVTTLSSDDVAPLEVLANWGYLLGCHAYTVNAATYQQLKLRWSSERRPLLRRLLFETLKEHAKTFGWTPENRADLERYRLDSSWLVRCKAIFVITPPQE